VYVIPRQFSRKCLLDRRSCARQRGTDGKRRVFLLDSLQNVRVLIRCFIRKTTETRLQPVRSHPDLWLSDRRLCLSNEIRIYFVETSTNKRYQSININLRTQQMSVLVLLCTPYTTCFGPYWWPSSGGFCNTKRFEGSYCIHSQQDAITQ
jgi:hypothetical protein